MKGIILAGGHGSRLSPLTVLMSKHVLPVYDKPMIYYPLSVLMEAGIREILIITTANHDQHIATLLGDGSRLGISLSYATQSAPNGISEALALAAPFLASDSFCLILGDNFLSGPGFLPQLKRAIREHQHATVFAYKVADPRAFGVVEFENQRAVSIEEKPCSPKSSWAVPGLYLYDHRAARIVANIPPSTRGDLGVSDINQAYLAKGQLAVECLIDCHWEDMGTPENLLEASNFVASKQAHGTVVACLEVIAFQSGFISRDQLKSISSDLGVSSPYGKFVAQVAADDTR